VPEGRIWSPDMTLASDIAQFEYGQNAELRTGPKVAQLANTRPVCRYWRGWRWSTVPAPSFGNPSESAQRACGPPW